MNTNFRDLYKLCSSVHLSRYFGEFSSIVSQWCPSCFFNLRGVLLVSDEWLPLSYRPAHSQTGYHLVSNCDFPQFAGPIDMRGRSIWISKGNIRA